MIDNPEPVLDLTQLVCPLPVLRTRKKLETMCSGSVLKVIASDPMSAIDMPHFCSEQGHCLLSYETQDMLHIFKIRRR